MQPPRRVAVNVVRKLHCRDWQGGSMSKIMNRRDENLICLAQVAYGIYLSVTLYLLFGPWFYNYRGLIALVSIHALLLVWYLACSFVKACYNITMTVAFTLLFIIEITIKLPVVVLLNGLGGMKPFIKSRYLRLIRLEGRRYQKRHIK